MLFRTEKSFLFKQPSAIIKKIYVNMKKVPNKTKLRLLIMKNLVIKIKTIVGIKDIDIILRVFLPDKVIER